MMERLGPLDVGGQMMLRGHTRFPPLRSMPMAAYTASMSSAARTPVGQQVELLLPVLLHREQRCVGGGDALLFAQKCGELFGQLAGVKQPMQVGAEHIGLHTPFRRAVGQNAERAALHCRAPGVDLVAGQLCPGKGDGLAVAWVWRAAFRR